MSRVKCKKDNYVLDLIDGIRLGFAKQRKKDQMLDRINERLRRLYGFH